MLTPEQAALAETFLPNVRSAVWKVDERGEQAYKDACAGLINLAAMILLDVRQNTGTDELELLQRYGLAIQSLKPPPPEEPT